MVSVSDQHRVTSNTTCGESVQPLQSENWYISRAHGQERLKPSHVIEIIALIQLYNVPGLIYYPVINFFHKYGMVSHMI